MFKKILVLSIATLSLTVQCTKKENMSTEAPATEEATMEAPAEATVATDATATDATAEVK